METPVKTVPSARARRAFAGTGNTGLSRVGRTRAGQKFGVFKVCWRLETGPCDDLERLRTDEVRSVKVNLGIIARN